MVRRNRPTQGPRNRLLCVEPLEYRWLLSGLQLTANPAADAGPAVADIAATTGASAAAVAIESTTVHNAAVEVVELGVATEDGASDVQIARSNLPIEIVAALDARFPGAELIEAELDAGHGTSAYEVIAEWGGHPIGVTLTLDGNIMETTQALTWGELPQPVLDWVRQNFPGAVIGEAERVTEADAVSYQVLIVTPGQQEFEATLRVQDAEAPRASMGAQEEVGNRPNSVLMAANATTEGLSGSIPVADATAREAPLESEISGKSHSDDTAKQAPDADVPSHEQTESQHDRRTLEQASAEGAEPQTSNSTATDASTSRVSNSQASPLAESLRTLAETVAHVSPTAWLPQVAGVISDLLPIDLAAVEQGLQQILDEIDSLAEKVVSDTGGLFNVESVAPRVVIVAALVTGAQLVILESRKSKREPVLVSGAANSSWSWVLGAATPKRP